MFSGSHGAQSVCVCAHAGQGSVRVHVLSEGLLAAAGDQLTAAVDPGLVALWLRHLERGFSCLQASSIKCPWSWPQGS